VGEVELRRALAKVAIPEVSVKRLRIEEENANVDDLKIKSLCVLLKNIPHLNELVLQLGKNSFSKTSLTELKDAIGTFSSLHVYELEVFRNSNIDGEACVQIFESLPQLTQLAELRLNFNTCLVDHRFF